MGEVVSLHGWKDSKVTTVACRTPDSGSTGYEDPGPAQEDLSPDDLSTVDDVMDALLVYERSGHERFPIWYTVLEPPQLMNGGRPACSNAPWGPAG